VFDACSADAAFARPCYRVQCAERLPVLPLAPAALRLTATTSFHARYEKPCDLVPIVFDDAPDADSAHATTLRD